MKDVATQIIDIELGPHDIQALNGADAVAALFARLGYNTDVRTLQTANNLGITAEGTTRPIKKIELIGEGNIKTLLATIDDLRNKFGEQQTAIANGKPGPFGKLNREDLRLICFDLVTGG